MVDNDAVNAWDILGLSKSLHHMLPDEKKEGAINPCEEFIKKMDFSKSGQNEEFLKKLKKLTKVVCCCSPSFRKLVKHFNFSEWKIKFIPKKEVKKAARGLNAIALVGNGNQLLIASDVSIGLQVISIAHEMTHVAQGDYVDKVEAQFFTDPKAVAKINSKFNGHLGDLIDSVTYKDDHVSLKQDGPARRIERIIANELVKNCNHYIKTFDTYERKKVPHMAPQLNRDPNKERLYPIKPIGK